MDSLYYHRSNAKPQKQNKHRNNSFDNASYLSHNKNIGPFILGPKLGEGTFGVVRWGTHLWTGEKVAIKILEKARILEQTYKTRVEREIKIWKCLRHNNIVQWYSVIQTVTSIYLIMEYVSGRELFDYIVLKKRLKENEACKFYQQILSGIEYLHKLRIVHRDLKPENLLLDCNKNIKIVDFGLSNVYAKGQWLNTACGSPSYAAPEMLNGKPYQSVMVDIWSSGIILFAMLCGFWPFEDSNNDALYKKITEGRFSIPSYVSEPARDWIRCILNTDPKKRYKISEIKKHPWFNSISPSIKNNEGLLMNLNVIPVDEDIVTSLQEFGFSKVEIRSNVLSNRHNHITTTYYLLLKIKTRKGIASVSDLVSNEFLKFIRDEKNLFSRYNNDFKKVIEERGCSKENSLIKEEEKEKEQEQDEKEQYEKEKEKEKEQEDKYCGNEEIDKTGESKINDMSNKYLIKVNLQLPSCEESSHLNWCDRIVTLNDNQKECNDNKGMNPKLRNMNSNNVNRKKTFNKIPIKEANNYKNMTKPQSKKSCNKYANDEEKENKEKNKQNDKSEDKKRNTKLEKEIEMPIRVEEIKQSELIKSRQDIHVNKEQTHVNIDLQNTLNYKMERPDDTDKMNTVMTKDIITKEATYCDFETFDNRNTISQPNEKTPSLSPDNTSYKINEWEYLDDQNKPSHGVPLTTTHNSSISKMLHFSHVSPNVIYNNYNDTKQSSSNKTNYNNNFFNTTMSFEKEATENTNTTFDVKLQKVLNDQRSRNTKTEGDIYLNSNSENASISITKQNKTNDNLVISTKLISVKEEEEKTETWGKAKGVNRNDISYLKGKSNNKQYDSIKEETKAKPYLNTKINGHKVVTSNKLGINASKNNKPPIPKRHYYRSSLSPSNKKEGVNLEVLSQTLTKTNKPWNTRIKTSSFRLTAEKVNPEKYSNMQYKWNHNTISTNNDTEINTNTNHRKTISVGDVNTTIKNKCLNTIYTDKVIKTKDMTRKKANHSDRIEFNGKKTATLRVNNDKDYVDVSAFSTACKQTTMCTSNNNTDQSKWNKNFRTICNSFKSKAIKNENTKLYKGPTDLSSLTFKALPLLREDITKALHDREIMCTPAQSNKNKYLCEQKGIKFEIEIVKSSKVANSWLVKFKKLNTLQASWNAFKELSKSLLLTILK